MNCALIAKSRYARGRLKEGKASWLGGKLFLTKAWSFSVKISKLIRKSCMSLDLLRRTSPSSKYLITVPLIFWPLLEWKSRFIAKSEWTVEKTNIKGIKRTNFIIFYNLMSEKIFCKLKRALILDWVGLESSTDKPLMKRFAENKVEGCKKWYFVKLNVSCK